MLKSTNKKMKNSHTFINQLKENIDEVRNIITFSTRKLKNT